ncbi:MAG: ATP-binding protein [Chloroflexota bacterium]|jgi:predicted AAA+ superfamily ATPase
MSYSISRKLTKPDRSFFLFGPRGTGKSTWLRHVFPDALYLDLLDASLFLELSRDPHRLEAIIGNQPQQGWVILDEIQKIPVLLDEVHRLLEKHRWRFALCGSSARKLKRGGANLLAGRALTISMESFSASELRDAFELDAALSWGTLPLIHGAGESVPDILAAYVNTYLKEEIQAEGFVRNVPPFIRFLAVAGQVNGQVLNVQNISRETAVARSTVDTYFSILVDTLVGHMLPAWRPGLKVREAAQPKFYWFDPGVARGAAGLLRDPPDRMWQGAALETLVFHELRVYNEVSSRHRPISYYRTPAGVEIDFVVETAAKRPNQAAEVVAIEVKRSEQWRRHWNKAMLDLPKSDKVAVHQMIGVYCGERIYRFGDVVVYPVKDFIQALYAGQLF